MLQGPTTLALATPSQGWGGPRLASAPGQGRVGRLAGACLLSWGVSSSPQNNCGLEDRIASLGSCNNSKLEFGSFWELIGEAAKSVKLEKPVRDS